MFKWFKFFNKQNKVVKDQVILNYKTNDNTTSNYSVSDSTGYVDSNTVLNVLEDVVDLAINIGSFSDSTGFNDSSSDFNGGGGDSGGGGASGEW